MIATLTAALLLGTAPQEPAPEAPEPPGAEQLIASYRALSEDKRRSVVRALERRLQLEPYEPLQRIMSMARGFASYPEVSPLVMHDPQKVAPGVAPPRKRIVTGTAAHTAVRRNFPVPTFLDDLQQAVVYDWAEGRAARAAQDLHDDALFANLAHGFPPGTDHTTARILQALDRDQDHRALARWFEHLYADVNGNVFEDVTLYQAWYAGKLVDVPDVDAIPFARQFLETQSFRSPIPADRRRDRLYQKILEAAFEHRKYRTLRQAAAAAFVDADPVFDPTYQPLVARFHYLWATVNWRVEDLAGLLVKAKDRAGLLEDVDQKIKGDPAAFEIRENNRKELQALERFLRDLCDRELQRAQG